MLRGVLMKICFVLPLMSSIRRCDTQKKQNINHVVFLLITTKFLFHIIHQYDHEGPRLLKMIIINHT